MSPLRSGTNNSPKKGVAPHLHSLLKVVSRSGPWELGRDTYRFCASVGLLFLREFTLAAAAVYNGVPMDKESLVGATRRTMLHFASRSRR